MPLYIIMAPRKTSNLNKSSNKIVSKSSAKNNPIDETDPRNDARNIMTDILEKIPQWKKITPKKTKGEIILTMENSCFERTLEQSQKDAITCEWSNPQFRYRYSMWCCRIIEHLDPDSDIYTNTKYDMINTIKTLNANKKLNTIAYLSNDELCPEASQELRDTIAARMEQKVDYKFTENYACPKCKNRKITQQRIQKSSADEMSSVQNRCLECKFSWFT